MWTDRLPTRRAVLSHTAAGVGQDWGTLGTSISAQADLASITASLGYDISLGTLP